MSASEHLRALNKAEAFAGLWHVTYERLAPDFGYETRPGSRVQWHQVPEPNRSLMIAVAQEILNELALPAVIAVVEAAEMFALDPEAVEPGRGPVEFTRGQVDAIQAAVAALREQLEGERP